MLLCFLLDLRNISPSLFRDLKQSLLKLANLYALSSEGRDRVLRTEKTLALPDLIGLCYIQSNESSSSFSEDTHNSSPPLDTSPISSMDLIAIDEVDPASTIDDTHQDTEFEGSIPPQQLIQPTTHAPLPTTDAPLRRSTRQVQLKVAYNPGESFNLRDFHQAVNNLPMNFSTESSEHLPAKSDNQVELSIGKILSDKFFCKWNPEDAPKKLIVTTTYVFTSSEPLQKILKDAASQLITIEFVLLESEVMSQDKSGLICLDQLQNCVIHRHISDSWILSGLVRGWLQDIRNSTDALEAFLIFKHSIWGSSSQISCKLFATSEMILDGFSFCRTCRCHGCPVNYTSNNTQKNVCPVTLYELGESDLINNMISVEGRTVMVVPSVESSYKLQSASGPITLNIIERTNLASLNEGVIMGTSFIVTPACHKYEAVSDYHGTFEMNTKIFYGLCESLHCLDQGLVCSSTCNLETMKDGIFMSFYILQPSFNGAMLLRRLASSEEVLPIPSQVKQSVVSEEVKNFIFASLSKVNLRDYNPLEHERGLHPHLNFLVKDSVHFGTLSTTAEMSSMHAKTPPKPAIIQISEEDKDGCPNPKQERQLIFLQCRQLGAAPYC